MAHQIGVMAVLLSKHNNFSFFDHFYRCRHFVNLLDHLGGHYFRTSASKYPSMLHKQEPVTIPQCQIHIMDHHKATYSFLINVCLYQFKNIMPVLGSKQLVGSSKSSSSGSWAIALASITFCFSPPDNSSIYLSFQSPIPSLSRI